MSSNKTPWINSPALSWFWALTEQFGARAISLLVGIILARLLQPEEFGLLASVSIFVTISQQIIDGGIALRVIQKHKITDEEYNALFFGNLAISVLMAAGLALSAGAITTFFGLPELKGIILVLSLWVIFANAGRVQRTKLTREGQFRALAVINLTSAVFGAVTGVAMALAGYGVWALVGQMLAIALMNVILLFRREPWRPNALPKLATVSDLYSFGLPILICQSIRSASNQMINLLTAKFYSPGLLGYYDRGGLIPRTVLLSLGNVLTKVNFTALSKLQNEDQKLKKTYLSFYAVGFGSTLLTLASMGIFARDIVGLVLGDQWLPSVFYFQMACLVGITHIAFQLNVDLLKSLGKTKIFFKSNTICAVVQIICVVLGARWGIDGMIYGDLGARVFAAILLTAIVAKSSQIGMFDQFKEFLNSVTWCIPLVIFLYAIQWSVGSLFARITLGLLTCGVVTFVWWRFQNLRIRDLNA